jgi:2-desacetyl-2-hydroxyethyl bacteriochlorophyllide A dehydrogenase
MKAVVITEPDRYELRDLPEPEPGAGHVLVEVAACGMCGTDRHTLAGKNPLVRFPAVPGHEFSGTVAGIGEGVADLELGQAVAVDPSRSCGHCRWCWSGRANLCPEKGGYGSRYPGGFAELAVVERFSCHPLPPGLAVEDGALAEPLACVLHGLDNLGPVTGQRVRVYGAGPIGLLTVAMLRRAGAAGLSVVEPSGRRREAALDLGADAALAPGEEADSELFDVVVDATGVGSVLEGALPRLDRGGRLLLMGVADPAARVSISPFDLNWKELTLVGSMAILNTFERAVEALAEGAVTSESLVSSRLGLDGFGTAMGQLGSPEHLKTLLLPALTAAGAAETESEAGR